METQGITPVQIIQELLALLTTRNEAVEKIKEKKDAETLSVSLKKYSEQSDKYIAELRNELSAFGDAVMADVDRDNEYHAIWKKAMENQESKSASDMWKSFLLMEDSLQKTYTGYTNATAMSLPESLKDVLNKEREELSTIAK